MPVVSGAALLIQDFSIMLCEACHQRQATVHLTTMVYYEGLGQEVGTRRDQHF